MQVLSLIILVMLSLVAYSGGAAAKAGKRSDLKPKLIDLALVLLIWTAAVLTRASWRTASWRLIAVWIVVAAFAGFLAVSLRRLPALPKTALDEAAPVPPSAPKRTWQAWAAFSRRMGSFQSRVLLSLFFFIIVTPFAVLLKAVSDPLRIKRRTADARASFWLAKREATLSGDEFRRQF
jgi:hypothetical protein